MTNSKLYFLLFSILMLLNICLLSRAETELLWHSFLVTDVQLIFAAVCLALLLREPGAPERKEKKTDV